jgi:outer membrane receptor protein involved in Fe transport
LSGSVGLRWQPRDAFHVEPFVRFAAAQNRLSDRDDVDPCIDPRGTPAWATLNMRVGYRWSDHWDAIVALTNLTDASYGEHGSGVQAPGVGFGAQIRARF